MISRYICLLACPLFGLCLLGLDVCAAENSSDLKQRAWGGTVTIGVVSWTGLEELEPAEGGRFDSLGYGMEFAFYRNLAQWGSADVLVGADFAIFGTDSDVSGSSEDYTQRGLYLTPSVKWRFGERDGMYMNLAAGLGWYKVDLVELDCDGPGVCFETDEQFDKDSLGGYLGISGGFFRWLLLDLKIHHVDFGKVTLSNNEEASLTGPIFMLAIGVAFGG